MLDLSPLSRKAFVPHLTISSAVVLLVGVSIISLVSISRKFDQQYDPSRELSRLLSDAVFKRKTSSGLQYVERESHKWNTQPDAVKEGQGGPNSVLFAVTSSPNEREVRDAIRKTWARNVGSESRLKFFVGRPEQSQLFEPLSKEMVEHGDIVFFENVLDTYNNLTLKTLALFAWAHHNANEKYIMKVDTDVYVKMSNLRTLLASLPSERVYAGSLVGFNADNAPYRRKDQYWVPEKWLLSMRDYPLPLYPPYYFGFAYLVSTDLAKPIGDCLPADFSCTAPGKQFSPWEAISDWFRPTYEQLNAAKVGLGGSYYSCELPESCLFRPLRFEDVTIGGILFSNLTGSSLDVNCDEGPGRQMCIDQVQEKTMPHARDVLQFVNFPWRKGPTGRRRCSDDFIAMHRVNDVEMRKYYAGGEGDKVKMCDLYKSRSWIHSNEEAMVENADIGGRSLDMGGLKTS